MNKPNCSTCPKENTKKCPIDFRGLNGNSDILGGMLRVTNRCLMGCHPGAREWLMKDVITELKHKQANAQGEISYHFFDDDCYREGIIKTCIEAISLIRDGVKK